MSFRFPLASTLIAATFGAAILSGCSSPGTKQAIEEVARSEAKAAKEQLSKARTMVLRGSELRGGDAKGRPLWSIGAKEIRAQNEPGEKKDLNIGLPKQAVLLDARATLYREGKPDTTFKAARIDLFNTPQGIRLHMSGGVNAKSAGPWVGERGPVSIVAPRADVNVQNKSMAASGGVKVEQGGVQVQSAALRAETSLQTMRLTGGVVAKTKGGQITAKTADWNWANDKVVAEQPVAQQGDTILKGAHLVANTSGRRGEITGGVEAKGPQGQAKAPSLTFDWEKDRILVRDTSFSGDGATLRAASVRTDSKLRVTEATGIVLTRDGGVLKADSASGFEKLTRIEGRGVSYQKDDATVTANRATWGGGRIQGQGGVTLRKGDLEMRGDRVDGDEKFDNARVSGAVRGKLASGGTFRAASVEKRHETILATEGVSATLPVTGPYKSVTVSANRLETDTSGSVAELKGNVVVTSDSGAVLRAPAARYDHKSQKITAKGGVFFRDPRGLEQRGDTLVADLQLQQATLTNVRGKVAGKLFEGKNLFQ